MSGLVGSLVGPYQVLALLGGGGMGDVYRARHAREGTEVALKVLSSLAAVDPAARERLRREWDALVRLRHPNIVRVYSAGEAGGIPYLAMEYIDGGSLAGRLRDGHPLDARLAAHWIGEIAAALDHAHSRGFVHRDIKPANVLLSRGAGRASVERAVLTDFGIARGLDSRLTAHGTILGTPCYMSPEQAQGQAVDRRGDIYSLAIVAYEMLSGQVPFSGDTLAVLHAHVHDVPRPIRQLNPRLSPATETVIGRALAKQPGQRYASAGEFARALTASLAARPAPTSAGRAVPGRVGREDRKPGARWWLAAGIGLLLLLVVAALRAAWNAEDGADSWTPSGLLAFSRVSDSNRDGTINEYDQADLCIWNLATGQREYVAQGPSYSGAPAWSADGSSLAFASNRDGNMEIYAMDMGSRQVERLTSDPAWDSVPSWSLTGASPGRLVFDSQRDGDSEIYVLDLTGGDITQLTFNSADDGNPAWSAGGAIAFDSNRDGNQEIYLMDANGMNQRRLTYNPADDLTPKWSPGGDTIAFVRGVVGMRFEIYLLQSDGSAERLLLSSPTSDCCPAWSPDGMRIAFSRRQSDSGGWDLYTVDAGGGDLRQLLSDGSANWSSAWRP